MLDNELVKGMFRTVPLFTQHCSDEPKNKTVLWEFSKLMIYECRS